MRRKVPGSGRRAQVTEADLPLNYQYLFVLMREPTKWFMLDIRDEKQSEAVAQFLRRRGCQVTKVLDKYRVRWTHLVPTEDRLNYTIRKITVG
jgi:hypothetical protein